MFSQLAKQIHNMCIHDLDHVQSLSINNHAPLRIDNKVQAYFTKKNRPITKRIVYASIKIDNTKNIEKYYLKNL